MDTRNGKLYPTRIAARLAGVPDRYTAEGDPGAGETGLFRDRRGQAYERRADWVVKRRADLDSLTRRS